MFENIINKLCGWEEINKEQLPHWIDVGRFTNGKTSNAISGRTYKYKMIQGTVFSHATGHGEGAMCLDGKIRFYRKLR
ncbi:MAG: hypothetical protein OIN86_13110 [Candidatus Methanoperedens sp.]|nr:hypothetical protein [Candidatus Methanoperedens sp.]CAG0949052.1 hypothetical protein METP1_00077 [Methanosarcinales archaeon]